MTTENKSIAPFRHGKRTCGMSAMETALFSSGAVKFIAPVQGEDLHRDYKYDVFLPPLSWLVRELFRVCRDISTSAEYYEWGLYSDNKPEYCVAITVMRLVIIENPAYKYDNTRDTHIEATEERTLFTVNAPTPEGACVRALVRILEERDG